MRLKILYVTKDFSNHVVQNQVYFVQELKKHVELEVWSRDGHINNILKSISFKPDFILINDLRPNHSPKIQGLEFLTIPFGVIMHDLHWNFKGRRDYLKKNNVKHIFSIYRDKFYKWYPDYSEKMIWFPHFVNTDVFKDYHLDKEIDMLFMGCYAWGLYPLREKIIQTLKDEPGFVNHEHPGYGRLNLQKGKTLIGEEYAKEINRSKIFLTCDSIYHYPLIKYYEVLACNTLLLASASKELFDLGFNPGEHFVEINEKNILETARYYLKHEEERLRITKNGYDMVRKNHSLEKRCNELISHISKIVKINEI